ncbi:hypothetical protein J7K19_05945 [bacterium]|nr:hypothetical protein [bacterium]
MCGKKLIGGIVLFVGMIFTLAGSWAQSGDCKTNKDTTLDEMQKAKYVGVAGCTCHMKQSLGNQYDVWIGTKHSRSWVVLQSLDARKLAKKMGIKGEPQQSPACLKCHGSAVSLDTLCMEATFHIEDGVQCETCHGQASQHVAIKMGQKIAAPMKLKIPTKEDCMMCHKEKKSHEMLNKKKFNIDKAWKKILHPIPKSK